jgi:hypothetical protein
VAARSSKCRTCDARTTSHTGFCQWCKSKRHHGYARVEEESLVVDQAGGGWWIWDARGNILVVGKPTRDAAIIALGAGDVEDDGIEAEERIHATKKSAAQLDAEIAEAIASRKVETLGDWLGPPAQRPKRLYSANSFKAARDWAIMNIETVTK